MPSLACTTTPFAPAAWYRDVLVLMVGVGFGSVGAVHHALGTHEEKREPLPEPTPFHDIMQTNAPGTQGTELRADVCQAAPDYGKTVPEFEGDDRSPAGRPEERQARHGDASAGHGSARAWSQLQQGDV